MWIVKPKPNPSAQLKLFCLPFAGGGSVSFRPWSDLVPEQIELIAVEIPGRGRRIGEPLRRRMDYLIPDMAQGLLPELDKPFALFGHSMGTLLAFELAHFLKDHQHPKPLHLFLSGRGAPHIPSRDKPIHRLADDEFIREIKNFNGTPKEVLEHEELMQIVVPILRADFEICETYQFKPKLPLEIPITVFGGLRDSGASREELAAWEKHTSSEFNLRMFPGDHFFLLEHFRVLIESMVRDLYGHFAVIG